MGGIGITPAGEDIVSAAKDIDTQRGNSPTLNDDPDLVVPYGLGAEYHLFASIGVTSASAVPDFKWSWALSAGVAVSSLLSHEATENSGWAAQQSRVDILSRVPVLVLDGVSIYGLNIEGYFSNTTAAGVLSFQWAQNVANATVVTVLRGSFLRLERVG